MHGQHSGFGSDLFGEASEVEDSLLFVGMHHPGGNGDDKPEDAAGKLNSRRRKTLSLPRGHLSVVPSWHPISEHRVGVCSSASLAKPVSNDQAE